MANDANDNKMTLILSKPQGDWSVCCDARLINVTEVSCGDSEAERSAFFWSGQIAFFLFCFINSTPPDVLILLSSSLNQLTSHEAI